MTTTHSEPKPTVEQAILPRLTPDIYLSKGFHDAAGEPRPELKGLFATAAATQLLRTEASPQALRQVHEAMLLVLPRRGEPAAERIKLVVEEAIEAATRATHQPVNPGIGRWLRGCAGNVRTEADIEAFGEHVKAVLCQYGAIVTFLAANRGTPRAL